MNTQPPVSGSARDIRAKAVRAWLRRNTGIGHRKRFTYQGIHRATGLTVPAVQRAVYDLRDHYHDDPLVVSVPCPENGFTVEVGWRWAAKLGMANRLTVLATQETSEAVMFERAASEETEPAKAFLYRQEAAEARLLSNRHREMADMMRAEAATDR